MLPLENRFEFRTEAFGEQHSLTAIDRFGVWLSWRQIRRHAVFDGRRVADFGCGYQASLARLILPRAAHLALADVSLAPDLACHPKVTAMQGTIPECLAGLPDRSFDVILCVSVLEHLWEPLRALREFRRLVAPGGTCLLNVPTWRGKFFLEFSAFRLGLSPAAEMDDHKTYYDPRDLWPLLVQAGFRPKHLRCFTHKFGLNTFAVCKTD